MTARRNLAAVAGGLGLTVALLSGGIFAVFTDRATTGPNDASTRAEARAADVKLAMVDGQIAGVTQCGVFLDDLETGVVHFSDLVPSTFAGPALLCLRNEGSAEVTFSVSVIDLVDLDVACTGDEAASGDTTCGADQLGEASGALHSTMNRYDCTTGEGQTFVDATLAANAQAPITLPALQTLAPGEVACISFVLTYLPSDQQLTQSDTATWRYAFDVTTT